MDEPIAGAESMSANIGEDIGLEMLSAAHLLLSSERITDERDLLISTCLEALSSGPSSPSALLKAVNEIWPGARVDQTSLDKAMDEARQLGLVAPQETLSGVDWALAVNGQQEIDASRAWFADAMDRLARQIQDRARDDFGEVTFEVATNWARLLQRVFSDEIARTAHSYSGDVLQSASGTIRPMTLDGGRMLRSLDAVNVAPGTTDFLKGCLLAAVDESDPFGNELVGQIATSCVLHAIAAGRGRVAAQLALGSLSGQRLVLDTPILVGYLGTSTDQMRLKSLILQAVRLGMEVIAPEHVFEELQDVIDRVTADHLPGLIAALKSGANPRSYALTVNEQILELFLDGVDAKRYSNWDEFSKRALSLGSELADLGVTIREHGNQNRANVAWIDQELTIEVANSVSGRGGKAIARDAESIELVWRSRRRVRRDKARKALWPGGWMVSYDRHINPTYRRVETQDFEPLVMTPAHWATLMAEAAPRTDIPELVQAAASFLRQESMLRIATKYPPAIALTLAKSLSGAYSSATDERVAQLASLSDMLEQTSNGVTVTGERLASELASRRSNRLAAAGREQVDLATLERVRLDAAITRSTTIVTEEHEARVRAEDRANALEEQNSLSGRRVATAVVITAAVAVIVIFVILHFWAFALGTLLSTLLFVRQSRGWVSTPTIRPSHLLWALLPELVGVYDIFTRLL